MKVFRHAARERGVYEVSPLRGHCDIIRDYGDKAVRCPNYVPEDVEGRCDWHAAMPPRTFARREEKQ